MHAWPAPEFPALSGQGRQKLPVRIFDAASKQLRASPDGPIARMYVCGITPYDATHLGHAATYVALDLLNRVWRDAGYEVRYVQNVTDVDDPLLERAAETGQEWTELARRETNLFREDMSWLRVLPPDHYVGVSESMSLVIDLVERLRSAGAAYEVDGDLYFSVQAADDFGAVSGLSRDHMLPLFVENGGDPERQGKKDPLDPILWRQERPGEPSWPSPFGPGRPGWHVECAAIASHYLGGTVDVQGGGSDLAFPHHEMTAAQAEVAGGLRQFAHSYVHAGMIGLRGEKMSKSLGNLEFASRLRKAGRDPNAVRLALMADHYRRARDWQPSALDEAEQRLARWRSAVARHSGPDATAVLSEVRRRLADDLDTPGALAVVDDWVAQADHGGEDPAAPRVVHDLVDALLGVAL